MYLVCRLLLASSYIYPLSLHDALPISHHLHDRHFIEHLVNRPLEFYQWILDRTCRMDDALGRSVSFALDKCHVRPSFNRVDDIGHLKRPDRKSTRLNSSHRCISYAVFCSPPPTSTLFPYTTLFRSHTISMIVISLNILLIVPWSFTSGFLIVHVVWMMHSAEVSVSHLTSAMFVLPSIALMILATLSAQIGRAHV